MQNRRLDLPDMEYARSHGWIGIAVSVPPPTRQSRPSSPLQTGQSLQLTAAWIAGLAAEQSPDAIIAAVSKFTAIPVAQLLARRSGKPRDFFTCARVITAYLLRNRTGLTYQEIGAIMRRTHSGVMHLCHQITRVIDASTPVPQPSTLNPQPTQ